MKDSARDIQKIPNIREIIATPAPPGIYFLVEGDEVIYIGQSINPIGRVISHALNGKKFSAAYTVPVFGGSMNQTEGALIRLFRPRENGHTQNGRRILKAPGYCFMDSLALESIGVLQKMEGS